MCGVKMKKKAAIIFAVTLTAALAPASGSTRGTDADISAIISHTVVIGDSSDVVTADWNEMLEKLDLAIQEGKGRNVNITVGDSAVVSADVLNRLAGKHATLALHMADDLTFSISGREIGHVDYPLQITLCEESGIPGEVAARALEGVTISRQFSMREKEAYPCRINVHLSLGAQNAGRHAVLYSYEEAGRRMRQEGIFRINGQGNAMFGLRRGDEYLVAVYRGYTVAEGETLSHIAFRNGISLQRLMAFNPQIQDADQIQIGQMVNLPN